MTWNEICDFLARPDLTGAEVDAALEGGLHCPHCNSRTFITRQRAEGWARFRGAAEGERRWSPFVQGSNPSETIGLACDGCQRLLWGQRPPEP